jgi:beta-glucosidase-like glycosyl hydrolase
VPGTSLTDEWRESLQRYPFGGVHLQDWNFQDAESAAALIAEIRGAIRQRGVTDIPLLALDHEGGNQVRATRHEYILLSCRNPRIWA